MSTVTSYATERSPAEVAADAACLARVQRGIAWLQQQWGDDWVDHIDLDKLKLASASCCVLGQLYADKADGTYSNGFDYANSKFSIGSSQYGFDADRNEEGNFSTGKAVSGNYDRLDRIWKQKILAWKRGVRD